MIEYVLVYARPVEPQFNKIPMVIKKRPEFLKGRLNLPGGKLEEGENPIRAAIRELKEETGLEELIESDPMCVLGADYLGKIVGSKSKIHCVRVPITFRQEIVPGPNEDEEMGWYDLQELLDHKDLMPNLRLVIPLMESGYKDWTVIDTDGDWSKRKHKIYLQLPNNEHIFSSCVDVTVPGLLAFKDNENEL